jgi:hypothetical protein
MHWILNEQHDTTTYREGEGLGMSKSFRGSENESSIEWIGREQNQSRPRRESFLRTLQMSSPIEDFGISTNSLSEFSSIPFASSNFSRLSMSTSNANNTPINFSKSSHSFATLPQAETLPSFFVTSLATPIKFESLEEDNNHENEMEQPGSTDADPSHPDALPVITTDPIEDDEDEEEDHLAMTSPAMTYFSYGFGGNSNGMNNVWKTTPTKNVNPPPGFGGASGFGGNSGFGYRLSGSEGRSGIGIAGFSGPHISNGAVNSFFFQNEEKMTSNWEVPTQSKS